MFSFFVPGEPKGKARPRVTVHGTYTPKSSKEYESRVKAAFVKKYPAYKAIEKGIPVNVYIIAYFKIPKIFGYGLNFQNCRNCVFCGMDYSYENYYQAVRRFWRFGQKNSVNVYRVIGETEKHILDVVNEKQRLQDEMHENMYHSAKQIQQESIKGHKFTLSFDKTVINLPEWVKGV